ncbi:MAG: integral rane sensor signal transduction histidine kinase [Conexibacter sp.]|nr:integral rane sensor signal transduction histidine kinase [Conexibacter sp.]
MTLRRRLVLLAAAAVAIAIVLASTAVYVTVRGELRGRIDGELRAQVPRGPLVDPGDLLSKSKAALRFRDRVRLAAPKDKLGLQTAYVARISSSGIVERPPQAPRLLPVTAATRAVATGTRGAFFADATIQGTPVRVYTAALPGQAGYAMQVARSLDEVNRTLDRLLLVLVLVCVGGIALAAALGWVIARTALGPVAHLTDAAEHVAETTDLSRRIELTGDDELGRLARSFNLMLAALEASVGRQRQLVADASHELRTPLTSVRTNIEVLARGDGLAPEERRRVFEDVVAQLDELGALVGDLVELAREEERDDDAEDLRFDVLVEEALARAQRRPRGPAFVAALTPCVVRGVPARLDRAVANLLDNAAKWSPAGASVEVALTPDGALTVRDHGPGIGPEDLPHVFERFYRAPSARGMPGSGLGLAIVRQVAELHGGSVAAEAAPGGGALLRLTLPGDPAETDFGEQAPIAPDAAELPALTT